MLRVFGNKSYSYNFQKVYYLNWKSAKHVIKLDVLFHRYLASREWAFFSWLFLLNSLSLSLQNEIHHFSKHVFLLGYNPIPQALKSKHFFVSEFTTERLRSFQWMTAGIFEKNQKHKLISHQDWASLKIKLLLFSHLDNICYNFLLFKETFK